MALLGLTDVLSLSVAALVAFLAWALPVRGQPISVYLPLAPVLLLFILGYAGAGLYPGFGLGPVDTLRRSTQVTAFGFLVLAAFSFAFKLPAIYSRVTFTFACALSLVFVPLGRAVLRAIVGRRSWWPEPVIVIGHGEWAVRAIRSLLGSPQLGYRPYAVLAETDGERIADVEGVPVAGGFDQASRLADDGVRVVLIDSHESQGAVFFDHLQRRFRHVVLLRQAGGLPVEGLEVRNLGAVVGIEYTNQLLVHRNRIIKRALDAIIGAIALLLAAPIIACAAVLVTLADRGPLFFLQDRGGLDGRRISVPKIRTMNMNAERQLEDHLTAHPERRSEWQEHFKLRDDPRLIRGIGRLFRRFSIDELPQFWSVLKGDMSLVGPRPFPDYHTVQFSPAFRELRQRVRPGITGLWQITVRSDGTIDEQETYDSYYIRNWSVWLDIYILARTLLAVASGRGAY